MIAWAGAPAFLGREGRGSGRAPHQGGVGRLCLRHGCAARLPAAGRGSGLGAGPDLVAGRQDLPVATQDGTYSFLAGWTPDNRIGILIPNEELTAIYRTPASGGRAVQLTPRAGWMPTWAPDGMRIYFDGR